MNEVVYDLDALCASAPTSESAAQKKYVTILYHVTLLNKTSN